MSRIFFTLLVAFLYSSVYGQVGGSFKNNVYPEMATIPGGNFIMGNNKKNADADEKPLHYVKVSSFQIGKYEITVRYFAAFVTETGYKTDAEKAGNSWVFDGAFTRQTNVTWRDDEEGHMRNNSEWNKPVIHVSWNDAIAYCNWLSNKTGKKYRLPTEAEWEYAAGNGIAHTTYSWGSYTPGKGAPVGNVADEAVHPKFGALKEKFTGYNDGYFFAAPVGSFPPNKFGLYDMTGNVWEWCNDWFDEKYYSQSPVMNPQGAKGGLFRSIRGGSWFGGPYFSNVAYRAGMPPDYTALNIGFRVVCAI